jgi:hypothetical protein
MIFTPSSSKLIYINDNNTASTEFTPKAPKIAYQPDYNIDYSLLNITLEEFSLDESFDDKLNKYIKEDFSNKADINQLLSPKSYSIIKFLNLK